MTVFEEQQARDRMMTAKHLEDVAVKAAERASQARKAREAKAARTAGTKAWQAEQRAQAAAEREASMARSRAAYEAGRTATFVPAGDIVGDTFQKRGRRFVAVDPKEKRL